MENWKCTNCDADLGEHPYGISIICPICKKTLFTRGFDNIPQTKEQAKSFEGMRKLARKHVKQNYAAMRER